MSEPRAPRIDACVHPYFRTNGELRDYLEPPWRNRGIPDVEKNYYSAPGGDFLDGLGSDSAYPASDPGVVAADLFDRQGLDAAVLLPIGRGTNPDRRLWSAICAGMNDWLAQRWVDSDVAAGRFLGSIRINPTDPVAAVREIERWADHPRMVQVAVPLESREPYGKPQFQPIWEAAAHYRLPVVTLIEGGAGIDFSSTPAGSPRSYAAYTALARNNCYYHLLNLIAEGVFERLDDLVFVFGDGGADFLTPMMWRYDTFWRAFRDVVPWSPRRGSEYLARHVRFISSRLEGPPSADSAPGWYQQHDKAGLLMYGSHYPLWSADTPDRRPAGLDDAGWTRVRGANAVDLYRLGSYAAT
jgi:predicted TIM-barrel fold metal-dependent hydrolase